MANIPTIPGSARVPDIQIGAKRNVQPRLQALGGVRQAAGAANAAIGEAMGQVAEYEQRKQKAEEVYAVNMTTNSLQDLHKNFLHNIKGQPDEQIADNWVKTAGEWKQSQMDQYAPKLSPRAQRFLSVRLDHEIGMATGEFQGIADKIGVKRRVGAGDANSLKFLQSGDPAKMPNAIAVQQAMVGVKDQSQEEMDEKVKTYPQILEVSQAENLIEHAANRAYHKLNEGGYPNIKDEATRLSLENKALGRWNANMVKKYQEVRKNQEAGHIYTKKELNGLADAEELKGSSIKEALDAQGGEVAPEDIKANVSKVHDMILEMPKDASPEQQEQARLDIISSQEYQHIPNPVKKQFDGDLKAGKSELPEIHRTQAEMMKQTFEQVSGLVPTRSQNIHAAPFIEGGMKKLETMPQADFNAAFRHQGTRQQILQREGRREEAARDWYADAQTQYRSWATSKKGQEAKPAEAEAERVRLGFGTYGTVQDVIRDFQAGKMDSATCKKVGFIRFGIE